MVTTLFLHQSHQQVVVEVEQKTQLPMDLLVVQVVVDLHLHLMEQVEQEPLVRVTMAATQLAVEQ
jgi:hypothetical protein